MAYGDWIGKSIWAGIDFSAGGDFFPWMISFIIAWVYG
jgi:hypothetical protein